MNRFHAATVAAIVFLMTGGVGGRLAAGPWPVKAAPPAQGRPVLERMPQAGRFLGLRMLSGRMYAVNASGGADIDVTPRVIVGPLRALPVRVPIPPAPVLPRAPKSPPHR